MFEVAGLVATDAGMQVLWNPERFTSIVDYDSWEDSLLEDEDLLQHVSAGMLVPINLGDGAFQFVVRVGDSAQIADLTGRERVRRVVTSDPYLITSPGALYLTGLEHVSADPDEKALHVTAPAGRYTVTINLIDWESEQDSRTPAGTPSPHALPDFVLLLNQATSPEPVFRQSLQTLPPPPDASA
ncbi:hypothetical protein [Micromonospora auratinigra]|uniref:Uncharacterized protein n=1 Tax=Micromonospora auratinigra TaxID=261654 RepID=A0A1A8ZAB4_9ACTN|nr:hypothetical protein [Micromonospora auratinigra]SBT40770.1 hypothetical protein GA0070611_1385 [Micromonospora auratinigra]